MYTMDCKDPNCEKCKQASEGQSSEEDNKSKVLKSVEQRSEEENESTIPKAIGEGFEEEQQRRILTAMKVILRDIHCGQNDKNNSLKCCTRLKKQIRCKISSLIDVLRKRELELCDEIDELYSTELVKKDIDVMTTCYEKILKEYDEEKRPSETALVFNSDYDILKMQLEHFGELRYEVKSELSEDCFNRLKMGYRCQHQTPHEKIFREKNRREGELLKMLTAEKLNSKFHSSKHALTADQMKRHQELMHKLRGLYNRSDNLRAEMITSNKDYEEGRLYLGSCLQMVKGGEKTQEDLKINTKDELPKGFQILQGKRRKFQPRMKLEEKKLAELTENFKKPNNDKVTGHSCAGENYEKVNSPAYETERKEQVFLRRIGEHEMEMLESGKKFEGFTKNFKKPSDEKVTGQSCVGERYGKVNSPTKGILEKDRIDEMKMRIARTKAILEKDQIDEIKMDIARKWQEKLLPIGMELEEMIMLESRKKLDGFTKNFKKPSDEKVIGQSCVGERYGKVESPKKLKKFRFTEDFKKLCDEYGLCHSYVDKRYGKVESPANETERKEQIFLRRNGEREMEMLESKIKEINENRIWQLSTGKNEPETLSSQIKKRFRRLGEIQKRDEIDPQRLESTDSVLCKGGESSFEDEPFLWRPHLMGKKSEVLTENFKKLNLEEATNQNFEEDNSPSDSSIEMKRRRINEIMNKCKKLIYGTEEIAKESSSDDDIEIISRDEAASIPSEASLSPPLPPKNRLKFKKPLCFSLLRKNEVVASPLFSEKNAESESSGVGGSESCKASVSSSNTKMKENFSSNEQPEEESSSECLSDSKDEDQSYNPSVALRSSFTKYLEKNPEGEWLAPDKSSKQHQEIYLPILVPELDQWLPAECNQNVASEWLYPANM